MAGRDAFEAWFAASRHSKGPLHRPTFERFEDGAYSDDSTQRHWWTWQNAVKATAAPELLDALRAIYNWHNADTMAAARAAIAKATGAES